MNTTLIGVLALLALLFSSHIWIWTKGKKFGSIKAEEAMAKLHDKEIKKIFETIKVKCPDMSDSILKLYENREEALRNRDAS